MKLRIGRKNMRTLYLQAGPEPSDDDLPLGFAVDWHTAHALCEAVNEGHGPRISGGQERRWTHLADMARMANFIEPPRPPGD